MTPLVYNVFSTDSGSLTLVGIITKGNVKVGSEPHPECLTQQVSFTVSLGLVWLDLGSLFWSDLSVETEFHAHQSGLQLDWSQGWPWILNPSSSTESPEMTFQNYWTVDHRQLCIFLSPTSSGTNTAHSLHLPVNSKFQISGDYKYLLISKYENFTKRKSNTRFPANCT